MSYLDALNRAHDRKRSLERRAARALKLVALDADDCDALADFDESEALALRERNAMQRELY